MESTSFAERQWVSRHSIEPVGLAIYKDGVLADADANVVMVRMERVDETAVFERQAQHMGTGLYETLISSVETATQGLYAVRWAYSLDGVPQVFEGILEVGAASPAYDALDVGFKAIVESVWMRFADLYDSTLGGPHLQEYFQTRFGRGRMAQLLGVAVGRLNSVAQPHGTYSLDAERNPFPYAQWGPMLEQGLYVETIKHLIRSYTEQPDAMGIVTARMDRRDYTDRWRAVLADEAADYASMLDVFKIANMGLGRPRVLVSGGVYGTMPSPTRMMGSALARGQRYWSAGIGY